MDEIKNKIFKFYKSNKRMPSYSEVMELFDYRSKNSAHKLIKKLIDSSFLKKDSSGKILPADSFDGIRKLGLVEAGIPTSIDQEELDTLDLDSYLIKNRDLTFLLEVKGDSMIDAGINEGDLVVAERKEIAKDGDIVIAEIDGGWTLKYFKNGVKGPYLLPGNKKYKPLVPKFDLKVAAIVKGVIRKYS